MNSAVILQTIAPTNDAAVALINELNQYQIALYGIEKCNLESPEQLAEHKAYMIGAYMDAVLAGIGSVKIKNDHAEIKRMFVDPKFRGLGIADKIIDALEKYAAEAGMKRICLETGNKHTEALRFYLRKGYRAIDHFGSYVPNDVSVYMEKIIAE